MRVLLLLVALAAFLQPLQAGESCARLIVRPSVLLTKGSVRAEMRIARHQDHRLAILQWESEDGYSGSSRRQLDGESTSPIWNVQLPEIPPAHYVFLLSVYDWRGKTHDTAKAQILTAEGVER